MGKRFAAHFANLDNLGWMQSVGFAEAGIVTQFGGNPSPHDIKAAGMTATLNIFNDGSSAADQPGAAGGQWAGYFQSCVSNGWDCIGGEGVGGSVVGTIMNYCPYVNYGGIVGDQQYDMYSSPWNHPRSGGHGHWDYIETYDNSQNLVVGSCEQCANVARQAGAGHLGILIGNWMTGVGAQTYINILDAIGGDTILFWGGYGSSSSSVQGLASQLISHYGASKTGATGGGGGSGATAAAPKQKVIKCPCRHIWIGFKNQPASVTSIDWHKEFPLTIVGIAGWVDDNEKWIPNKPYTGKLGVYCKDSTHLWKLTDIWPDKNGHFSYTVACDKVETRHYGVKFETSTGHDYVVTWE